MVSAGEPCEAAFNIGTIAAMVRTVLALTGALFSPRASPALSRTRRDSTGASDLLIGLLAGSDKGGARGVGGGADIMTLVPNAATKD